MPNIRPDDLEACLPRLYEVTAFIQLTDKGTLRRGTGYLISRDLVATCNHVVSTAVKVGTPDETPTKIDIQFPGHKRQGNLLGSDPSADCALIKLTEPILEQSLLPLRLSDGCGSNEPFVAVGYPLIGNEQALPLFGHVIAPGWKDLKGGPASLLFSPPIAAGAGALAQGFSGSPVMVRGACVGHLKQVVPDPGHSAAGRPYSQLGYLFVCPSRLLQALYPTLPITSRMTVPRLPTRPSLRQLLRSVMKENVDLTSFIALEFTSVYQNYISEQMTPTEKVTRFLLHADRGVILDKLRKEYPKEVSALEGELEYEEE